MTGMASNNWHFLTSKGSNHEEGKTILGNMFSLAVGVAIQGNPCRDTGNPLKRQRS